MIIKNSTISAACSIVLLAAVFTGGNVNAQDDYEIISGKNTNSRWLHYSDAPNALYHHLTGQALGYVDERANIISKYNSLSDWQKRQKHVNETLKDIVGPFPAKTPLNAKIIRTLDKGDYRVEHIVYESQPGFYVTSSMFIPEGLKGKAPVILYASGHTNAGYRYHPYQHLILNLVKKGFIVFAFDPVGQGERLEYYDPETAKSTVGGPTSEHSYPGAQAFIAGSSQARYMIWDGIRAVDYLLTREEIDTDRIGITGMSGGGTQCTFIAALDDRIKASAPSNFITSYTRLLQSIGPQDAEQNLFNAVVRGLDYADLLEVRAPKPALVVTTTQDFFSIQGARETVKEVSRIYKAYGKEGNFGMVEDDAGHTVTEKNREAIYAFFQKHLDNPGNSDDQEVDLLTDEEIRVTKTGQISTSLGGESVYSLNKKDAEKNIMKLTFSRTNPEGHIPGVLETAKKLSGYNEPSAIENSVFTGRIIAEGYSVEKYFMKGEGDYIIPYLLMVPDKPNNKGLIYLNPEGKSADASAGGEMEWFVKQGFTILAPDLLGTGEAGHGRGSLRREWRASILIGRSLVGIHAGDVVRLTRMLSKNKGMDEVYGLAKKEMAPVLLHAAAFDQGISQVILIEPYSSYRSVVMNRFYNPAFIQSTVAGALTAYDLPDLAASLAPRKLIMADVTDGLGETQDSEAIMEDLSFIKTAYKAKKADGQLNIIARETSEKPYDLFVEWIK